MKGLQHVAGLAAVWFGLGLALPPAAALAAGQTPRLGDSITSLGSAAPTSSPQEAGAVPSKDLEATVSPLADAAPQTEQLQGARAERALYDQPLEALGVFGTNLWGGRGVRRSVSAFGMPRLSVGLSVGLDYTDTRSLFVTGDASRLSGQSFSLTFAPIAGLELAVMDRSLAFQYRNVAVPRNLMLQGSPSFQVKFGRAVAGPLALGARVNISAPTTTTGAGLGINAFRLQGEALISLQLFSWLEWTGNVGYIYDRANRQYSVKDTDAVLRYAYDITLIDRMSYATSAQARFGAGRRVDLSPFVEVSGEAGFKGGANLRHNPIIASAGARIMPRRSRAVELTLGVDARLTGSPALGSPYGGLAPYRIFGQISVHFRDAVRQVYNAHNEAGPQKPVVLDMFRVRGNVFDAQTGRPVAGVRMFGFDEGQALLTADPNDGHFVSWPVAREGDALTLHAEAPSYLPATRQAQRPAAGDLELAWQMTPSEDEATLGTLRGVIKHSFTGRAVKDATVAIASLEVPVAADLRGAFSVALRPGRYQATVSAPGFVTQQKLIEVESGETVELNLDLEPSK